MEKATNVEFRNCSDFRLLDREVVARFLSIPEKAVLFRGITSWFGYPSKYVYFRPESRFSGKSRWSLLKLIILALDAVTSFTSIPLRMITAFSAMLLIFSFVLGIQTIFVYLSGRAVEGFTTIIILVLLIGGILAGALGVIGEYLARIYEEVKGRPSFIVAERKSLAADVVES